MRRVAVISSNAIMLDCWTKKLQKDNDVISFPHALDFLDFAESNTREVKGFDFIIVDRIHPGFDCLNDGFVDKLRQHINISKKYLILASPLNMRFQKGSGGFDLFSRCGPYSINELQEKVTTFSVESGSHHLR